MFIGAFTLTHHDERSKNAAIGQDRVIKRHFTSQIRLYLEQPLVFDDFITKRKIEDRYTKTECDSDDPEFDGENMQLNIDQQSYGEQSINDDSDNVTKNCAQEIKMNKMP